MAKNPYFKDYSGEQNVIEDLSIEIIKAMGRDMLYIPREQYNKNIQFGEAQYKYEKVFPIEMYIASVSGFEGDGDVITKFGLEVKDRVTLVVSRKRFSQEVAERYDGITRPREGDLIYFPLTKGLFEINFVEHENPFYQAGKLYTYALMCELATLDNEEFNTGETDIDTVRDERYTSISEFTIGSEVSSSKVYYDGEEVYQVAGVTGTSSVYANATATAKCFKFYGTTSPKTMEIFGISGTFYYGNQTIKGVGSGAEYYLTGITGTNIIIPITPINSDADGDNESIKDNGDTIQIYDFTDIDPFSEGKY